MILRVVVDTNIIILATFWGNQPRELIKKAILGELQLLTLFWIAPYLEKPIIS
jgi:predicted nucleic acid-binding protein